MATETYKEDAIEDEMRDMMMKQFVNIASSSTTFFRRL